MRRRDVLTFSSLGLFTACTTPRRVVPGPRVELEPERAPAASDGQSIVVAGERVAIGAPVVTWRDPGGYDGYSRDLRFPEQAPANPPEGLRFAPGRPRADGTRVHAADGRAALAEVVDQFVLHYDVCGLSRTCFRVLHDQRKLSVHFLLDLDGTLYQTLDLAETAWHARQANGRSVGVEIANMGAYPVGRGDKLDEWYVREAAGLRLTIPERFGDGGLRRPGAALRSRTPRRVRGVVQGQELEMADFTPQQYHTLAKLAAALTRVFPRLRAEIPRGADGRVRREALDDAEFAAFSGILGHWHVTSAKVDPGPAFDWEAFLRRLRAEGAVPRT